MLYLPYDRGGLQLPNLTWYYWAAQIRAGLFYLVKDHPPAWVTMESLSLAVPINLYIYSANKRKLIKQTRNPLFKNTMVVGLSVLTYFGETQNLSQFSPMFGDDGFRPGRADPGFNIWATKGIAKVSDVDKEATCTCHLKSSEPHVEFRQSTFSNISDSRVV